MVYITSALTLLNLYSSSHLRGLGFELSRDFEIDLFLIPEINLLILSGSGFFAIFWNADIIFMFSLRISTLEVDFGKFEFYALASDFGPGLLTYSFWGFCLIFDDPDLFIFFPWLRVGWFSNLSSRRWSCSIFGSGSTIFIGWFFSTLWAYYWELAICEKSDSLTSPGLYWGVSLGPKIGSYAGKVHLEFGESWTKRFILFEIRSSSLVALVNVCCY